MYRISKSIEFDAGHRVPGHRTKCFNLHGHRYKVIATYETDKLISRGAEEGMVKDFGFIKEILMTEVHDQLDHKMILYEMDPMVEVLAGPDINIDFNYSIDWITLPVMSDPRQSLVVTTFIPTAENLAKAIYYKVGPQRSHIDNELSMKLARIDVYETPTSVASYSEEKR